MAKKRGKAKASAPPAPPKRDPLLLGLQVAAFLLVGLAIFQWYELYQVQQGGSAFCAIDEDINCEAIWNSAFAKNIHARTAMPIAGWGLIYGLAAVAVALYVGRKKEQAQILSVKLVGFVGCITSVVLVFVSWQVGTVCLMCVLTYTLVLAFTGFALKLTPDHPTKQKPTLMSVVGLPAAAVVAGYLVLLVPGKATPVHPKSHIPEQPVVQKRVEDKTPVVGGQLAAYLATLPANAKQAVSNSIAEMKKSPKVALPQPRQVHGNVRARVAFTDWSDIRCGHCAQLDSVMQQLEKTAPGSFSLNSRWFPLDSGCNPTVPPELKDPTGVRCLAPRVLICLEGKPGYEPARHALFEMQQQLTKEMVLSIAQGQGGAKKADLMACVDSEATKKKLAQDIEYAKKFDLHGTPLVLVNGKKASSVPPFLFAMILADGNIEHPAFASLPTPELNPHLH